MNTFLVLSTDGRSDGLGGPMRTLGRQIVAAGHQCKTIDLRLPGWDKRVIEAALSGDLTAAVAPAGFARNLSIGQGATRMNLWDLAGVPWIGLYGDHPAYAFEFHHTRHAMTSSIYGYTEHRNFIAAHGGPTLRAVSAVAQCQDPIGRHEIDVAAKRQGGIFFLKNGNDPEQLARFWDTLPMELRFGLFDIARRLRDDPDNATVRNIEMHVMSWLNDQCGDWRGAFKVALFMIAQLDDFARRIKSTLIAEALLDFPVTVIGDNWSHVDFSGRRARHIAGGDYEASRTIIRDSLAIIDMTPNTEHDAHERFYRALGRHTLCLCNDVPSMWDWVDAAGGVDPLFRYDADAIRACVAHVLADPDRAVEAGIAMAERAARELPEHGVVEQMLRLAELVRLENRAGRFKDQQDFVVWPPTLSRA